MKLRTLIAATAAALLGAASAAFAHDVTDPVCRMTVDSDTTPYQKKLGGKSFYFCTPDCQKKFAAAPARYAALAADLEKGGGHAYAVDLTTDRPAIAGKPVTLTLALCYDDPKKKALVRDFEVVHERLLHFVLTTEDLSWFAHEHPERGADGRFRLTWTFPRPGKYRLWADFTPADGDNQVIPVTLNVGGGAARTVPLAPDAGTAAAAQTRRVGDLTFSLAVQPGAAAKGGGGLRAEQAALLTYTVRDAKGRPVADLKPYLGAMGHLLAIRSGAQPEFVHTHALHALKPGMTPVAEGALKVTPAMATASGPALSFKLTLPTAGVWKTWAQFQRGSRVYTVPLTFRVAGLWDADPTKPAGGSVVQRATVRVGGGTYTPASLTVSAGRPVELAFVRSANVGCGDVVSFPSLGIKQALNPSGPTVVRFTPAKAGTLAFTCGMGHYRGSVVVR
jgi:YHS domain-containing protein